MGAARPLAGRVPDNSILGGRILPAAGAGLASVRTDLVCWLMRQGIMPLYTPVAGSWLNMAESIQRILVRRALTGHCPTSAAQVIEWLEASACGWNRCSTPFVWGGKRRARRQRARARRHPLGGSGACTLQVVQ